MLLTQLLSFLLRYLPSARILLDEVNLVSHKHNADILLSWIKQGLKPVLDILKGLSVSNVIDDQTSEGLSVMCHGDCSVLFLARRIPELCLDGSPIFHANIFGGKLDTNRGSTSLWQLILQVAAQ